MEAESELQRWPPGSIATDQWNWSLRKQIGADLTQLQQAACAADYPELAPLYSSYPLQAFYTDRQRRECWRLFGVGQREDGTLIGHVFGASAALNRCVQGGVPLESLLRCEQWSPDQLAWLRSGAVQNPGLFLDPLGVLLLAE